jgi:hypothetical protein
MSPSETAISVEEVDDDFIEDLVFNIEDGRVVPIIGPELLIIQADDREVLLHRYLAERLAERLRIDLARLPVDFTLADVAAFHARGGHEIEEIYSRLRAIMERHQFQVPEPLRKLARIEKLKLFVTTTFDSLLQQAIDDERFRGIKRTADVIYNPSDVNDLSADWNEQSSPIVFHLFGKLSAAPNYVVTDADVVEFLYAMQGNSPRLGHLFDALRGKHLLILGCAYPDWLARFFIRITRRREFQDTRAGREIIADTRAHADPKLTLFLNTFSKTTRIVAGDAITFIDRLAAQWTSRHPPGTNGSTQDKASASLSEGATNDVFISYSRVDAAAARRLFDGLEQKVHVWMDKQGGLQPGAEFDPQIIRQVRSCSLFLPVISRASAGRIEGFYRKEWNEALARLATLRPDTPFVVPIVIDDVPFGDSGVPARFWDFNVQELPAGNVTSDFRDWVVAKVRERQMDRPTGR